MKTAVCLAGATLLISLMLGACGYPIRNQSLEKEDRPPNDPYVVTNKAYDWSALAPDPDAETLLIVTASGGGSRAAGLALGTLGALATIPAAKGGSLADQIDIISSVSGGSVTAAYFALKGSAGLPTLESDFLRQDIITDLVIDGLNPVSLARLSLPSRERIDVLIDLFDDRLFKGSHFSDLASQPRRPYLILNAADMVEGSPFPFTQYTFDLLCSDLSAFSLSTAVAASAAFPVAFSPVTLKNYWAPGSKPCPIPRPPQWVPLAERTTWHSNPSRQARGRIADAYTRGKKAYIHLLDGGIADNLGVAEPYRLLTTNDVVPNLARQIESGRIKRVIFIMINARSFKESALDDSPETPGALSMLLSSISSSIDRASFGTAERLRNLMEIEWGGYSLKAANNRRESERKKDWEGAELQSRIERQFRNLAEQSAFLSVEFDAIPDADCRRKMQTIPTSWSLTGQQVDATIAMGRALLLANPDGKKLLALARSNSPPPAFATVAEVCAGLPAQW